MLAEVVRMPEEQAAVVAEAAEQVVQRTLTLKAAAGREGRQAEVVAVLAGAEPRTAAVPVLAVDKRAAAVAERRVAAERAARKQGAFELPAVAEAAEQVAVLVGLVERVQDEVELALVAAVAVERLGSVCTSEVQQLVRLQVLAHRQVLREQFGQHLQYQLVI